MRYNTYTRLDDITTACDNRQLVILVLGFYNAIDTINHQLLLSILRFSGLEEQSLQFFNAYFLNRCQCVSYNKHLSTFCDVIHGVPQGSMLGSFLFSLHTSQISSYTNHYKFYLYEDDTQLYHSFNYQQLHIVNNFINSYLSSISTFSESIGAKLNSTKTLIIMFENIKQRQITQEMNNICLNNVILTFNSTVEKLGLVVDIELRFKQNTNILFRKAYFSLKQICLCLSFFNFKFKRHYKRLCFYLILMILTMFITNRFHA